MRWLISQILGQSKGYFSASSKFNMQYLNFENFNASVLMTKTPNESIMLRARGLVELTFHSHAWCGDCIFKMNDNEWIESLYSKSHSFKRISIMFDKDKESTLYIECGATKHENSKGFETWLAGVDFAERQTWMTRSQPINSICNMTHGEYGDFITLQSDTVIGTSIVNNGIWARNDVELFKSLINPGMTVLDIGANIGHHTVVYSSLVGPGGRVLAFEPQKVIYDILCGNIALNGCRNAEAIRSIVGERPGYMHLYPVTYEERGNFGSLGVAPEFAEGKKGERVKVDTLDNLLESVYPPIVRCDFMKIDVQSYELFVLKGAKQTLEKFRPTLFLEISPYWMAKHYDYKEIYKFLWDCGYDINHFSDTTIANGDIKEWSGRQGEEWDILAIPK